MDKDSLVIVVENLNKKLSKLVILENISFNIPQGTWASIIGPSGSGKTTLLSLMAGLDRPTQGEIKINNQKLSQLNEDELSQFRSRTMGFVFQNFRLVPTLSALENVQIPLEILKIKDSEKLSAAMLKHVGLGKRLNHLPSQLSGGEQQRVALARAFVAKPPILFADEPTGNLDSQNGQLVLNLLEELHKEHGSTLVVVTHDLEIAKRGTQLIKIRDGKIE